MTDSNEPTAWEEINPVTVSVQRHALPSPYSAHLDPASSDDFRNELTACLALVAPVGMTEEAKRDWLAVAWGTLNHLPRDLLSSGCKKARLTCDHPSKIVPTIVAETEEWMRFRREREADHVRLSGPQPKKHIADRDRSQFTADDWAELNEYLERMESAVRYRPDGSRYMVS